MSVSDVLPLLTGGGGCIIALTLGIFLLVTGKLIPKGTHESIVKDKDQQIEDLVRSLSLERQRSDSATAAAQAATSVLNALDRYRPPGQQALPPGEHRES